MITTASEHQVDKVEQMAGGKGHVIIERLLGEKELDGKCGLYAKVTIESNCTLGFHEHHGETPPPPPPPPPTPPPAPPPRTPPPPSRRPARSASTSTTARPRPITS